MKLVLFRDGTGTARPGVLTDDGVVDASETVPPRARPQETMQGIIDAFEDIRPRLERLARDGVRTPREQVRLLPPLPRPSKIMCCIDNYT